MNEQYVEKRIREYSEVRIRYEEFAGQVLNVLKAIVKQEYPEMKIASYSKRAKEVESLRKKLQKDKYNEDRVRMPENKKFGGLKCEIQITSLIAHTWSEITHEKGYKFEGKLPEDLERRKNLLAGMLELADLEMDAYVESFDSYVSKIEQEIERGCLKYQINSMSLERFMAWKFPNISPQVFRDVDLILNELSLFGLSTIKELNELVRSEYEKEIQKT